MKKLIPAFSFALVACGSHAVGGQQSQVAMDFYEKYTSSSAQIEHIRAFGIEDQFAIFEFGNQVVHPPAVYLATPFAEQGPKIVPFLKGKLEETSDDATIRDITLIFKTEASLGLYDFSKDPEIIVLLSKKINDMQGPSKSVATDWLHQLQPQER